MAWDSSANAGFSRAEPWLPLHDDWQDRNVAAEERDPASMLCLTRTLLRLRREEAALSVGDYLPVAGDSTLLAYERHSGDSRLLVALNLGDRPVPLPEAARGSQRLLSTLAGQADALRGNEGVIVRLA